MNGSASPSTADDITVAICTRDRPEQLRRALASLLRQTAAPAEIVVVDNAPASDATRQLIAAEFPEVHYVCEAIPGLNFARNRALANAAGEIVAFIDDDAVADPNWIASTQKTFRESPTVAICTGRVDPLVLDTPGQRLFEANGGFARGNRPLRLPQDASRRLHGLRAPLIAWSISVGTGCSLAVRKEIIRKLGDFDEGLDSPPELPGGGDIDLLWRVLAAGYGIVYEPSVRVRHEHRREWEAAVRQILEHNHGLVAMLTKAVRGAHGWRRAEILAFLVWRLIKPGVRLARRMFGRDPLPARVLLRLWAACWRGLVAYPAASRAARLRAIRIAGDGVVHPAVRSESA
ncbi:hypothetical protein BH20GEM2_BH20GEM2_15320 [soil metagenome]